MNEFDFTKTLRSASWDGYRLLDSGHGRKLEQYGRLIIDRPEPQAMWQPRLSESEWHKADAVFTGGKITQKDFDEDDGRWAFRNKALDTWVAGYKDISFFGRFTPFRHVGFFPEQTPHWNYMTDRLQNMQSPALLNMFGYTGVASLLAAKVGAQVTHVDASKKAINFAKENQELSKMNDAPIRWICDDAAKFAEREVRRGRQYQGILLDPPKFGRGPNKEVWNLFEDLPPLLENCRQILDPKSGFLILTTYAVRASHFAFYELCREIFGFAQGDKRIQTGELVIREEPHNEQAGRYISTSMFCRIDYAQKS